jgi:tripartite-type tricarboxylate transporter receptor subunit TctC
MRRLTISSFIVPAYSKKLWLYSQIEIVIYSKQEEACPGGSVRTAKREASMIRTILKHGLPLLLFAVTGQFACAESYPAKVIRIVVPTGPGTPPDIISRIVANELSDSDGWKVIVENRGGALQTIATADVLKQPADGYTVLAMSVPMMAAPALLPHLGLRPETDFAPVIKLSASYNVLVVTPTLPARSVSELVDLLKSQPDKYNFSSAGFGTPAHLIGELFKLKTGVRATHVPYQQGQQRLTDLMNGTIQYDFIATVSAVDFIATGKLRALAVTAPKRVAVLEMVPTVLEQGYPGLIAEDWVGFVVRAGTPGEIIARLNESIGRALAKPNVRETFARLGAEVQGGSSADFGKFIAEQSALWTDVVKTSGITLPQ